MKTSAISSYKVTFKSFLSSKSGKFILTLLGIGFIFLLWFIISKSLNTTLFPDPGTTFVALGEILSTSYVWESLGATFLRLIVNIVISLFLALIIGLFAGLYDPIYRFLNPLIICLRTMPVAAVIYTVIVLTKISYALYIIVFLAIFPVMYESVAVGIKNIAVGEMEALRLETRTLSPQALFGIVYPSALGTIFLGIIQSLGLGMKVSIMAEVLCGTDKIPGLGRIIYHGYNDGRMDIVFATTFISIIIIGIFDILLRHFKKNINK